MAGRKIAASRRVSAEFRPLTADRWADFETLFGPRGACGGCWCMVWRLPRKEWEASKGDGNRRLMHEIVERGEAPGVLAYVDGRPVGWCSIAPRQVYVALERSRVLKPVDEQPVWSITCFYIHKDHRRRGLSTALIDAAVDFAARRGAKVIEGYPVEPYTENMPAPFAWVGIPAAFEKAGFTEVLRRSKTRPIMRRVVSASAKTRGHADIADSKRKTASAPPKHAAKVQQRSAVRAAGQSAPAAGGAAGGRTRPKRRAR